MTETMGQLRDRQRGLQALDAIAQAQERLADATELRALTAVRDKLGAGVAGDTTDTACATLAAKIVGRAVGKGEK